MLTRLAGGIAAGYCLPPTLRENGRKPEPPGSIARGRWASQEYGIGSLRKAVVTP